MSPKPCHCCDGTGKELSKKENVFIGRKLRYERESRGLKAAYIAACMGVSPQILSDLEHGRRKWTDVKVARYLEAVEK